MGRPMKLRQDLFVMVERSTFPNVVSKDMAKHTVQHTTAKHAGLLIFCTVATKRACE